MVGPVFDGPMPSIGGQNLFRSGFFGRTAGDSVDGFSCGFPGLDDGSCPLNGESLRHIRNAHVLNKPCRRPDSSDFYTTMPPVFLGEIWGKLFFQAPVGDVQFQIGLIVFDDEMVIGFFLLNEELCEFFLSVESIGSDNAACQLEL